jgi:hypothetical protein
MSADAVPNPTPTDSDVRLAPAPRHFPAPARQTQNRRNEPEKRSLGQNLHLSLNQSLTEISTGNIRHKYLFSM